MNEEIVEIKDYLRKISETIKKENRESNRLTRYLPDHEFIFGK